MNQKIVASILIAAGIILALFVFMAKAREDAYIKDIIKETGSCYLSDGTCLHDDRDYSLYIGGWILSAALIILGIYLFVFDRTQEILTQTHQEVSSALKEAKQKDEFKAFLSGFSEKEQLVLKVIHEQQGIKQSTLRYKTDLSKTELSLLLSQWEKKGIISRKPSGKSNEVYLKKRF